jgi:hypothetical protein
MSVFEIEASSLPNGDLAAAWFDNEQRTWDDQRLHKFGSLAGKWDPAPLKLFRAGRSITEVLFNPNAIAVSARIREKLCPFSELQFLPVAVEGCEPFFVVHVAATVEVSLGFSLRRAPPPSGNIVELYEFPVGYTSSTSFFRVRQPADSAGGRSGYCLRTIYTNKEGADALEAACGGYLNARLLRERVPS